jgi:hypothetical protein
MNSNHTFAHKLTVTEPTGPVTLNICTCGATMDASGCLGGHADVMALLRSVGVA